MKRKYKKLQTKVKKQVARALQFIVLLFLSFLLILYFISQPIDSIRSRREETQMENTSEEEFLISLTPYAQEVSESHGVRPSVLLAQAALESNWGQSQLAQQSYNYFGIKNKNGRKYTTQEFRENEWEEINTFFKEYDSPYDSVVDYANLLKNGTSWNEELYQQVIEADSYQAAAYALTEAGYATDPNYAEKIIEIIEQYELDTLDLE